MSNVVIDQRTKLNEDVDNYIKCKRELNSKEITKQSDATISELGLNNSNIIYYDEYAPMLILDVKAADIDKIASNSNIETIDTFENLQFESEPVENFENSTNSSESTVSDSAAMYIHKNAINGNSYPNTNLNGSGIVIGQVECGLPELTTTYFNELESSKVYHLNSGHNQEQSYDPNSTYPWYEANRYHASRVAAVLAGKKSMTSNATVYSTFAINESGFYTCIKDLLRIGEIYNNPKLSVDVINISAFFIAKDENGNATKSRNIDKWLDYYIFANNLVVIQSSGNIGNEDIMQAPSLAYNAITVGAINDKLSYDKTDDYVEPYSSYVNTGYCEKPDVVAPGNSFFASFSKIGTNNIPVSGTSFATPMVTSAVALMLQRDSTLKLKPYLIKSILLASCDRKVLDSDNGTQTEANNGITEKQGAGVINVKRAINIVDNKTYKTGFAYNKSVTYDITRTSTESFMTAGLAWNKYTTLTGNASTSYDGYDITNLNLILYEMGSNNSNYGYLASSFATNSSTEHIFASNPSGYNNKYRFAILKPTENEYSPQYALAWD